MERNKKGLIIFDFDGTLVDLTTNYNSLKEELHGFFLSYELDISFTPMLEKLSVALESLENKGLGLKELECVKYEVHRIIDKYELFDLEEATPHPKILSFIRDKVNEFDYCIVSNNGSSVIEMAIIKFGLPKPLFIVSRSNSSEPKPDPSALLSKLAKNKINKEECIIIGDAPVDKELGENAGIRSYIITPENEQNILFCLSTTYLI